MYAHDYNNCFDVRYKLVVDYFNEQYNYYSTIPEIENLSRKNWCSKGWVLPEVSHENVNADSL